MSDYLEISKTDKLKDFAKANVDEMGNVIVGAIGEMLRGSSSQITTLIGTAVSGVVPVVGNVITGWQMNKMERNINIIKETLEKHNTLINKLIQKVSNEVLNDMMGMLIEKSILEYQSDKVKMMSNGILSFADLDSIKMDDVVLFLNTMNQMTLEDVNVLKQYGLHPDQRDYFEYGENEKLSVIIDKLIRLGLLHDTRIDSIANNLEDLMKTVNTIQLNGGNLSTIPLNFVTENVRSECILTYFGDTLLEMIKERG